MGSACNGKYGDDNSFKTDFGNRESEHRAAPPTNRDEPASNFAHPVGKFPQLSAAIEGRRAELGQLDFSGLHYGAEVKTTELSQTYSLKNGWLYQGEWHDGKIWGKGRYLTTDKSYIECMSAENYPVGKIRMIHPNGDFYQGQILNFMAEGMGVLHVNGVTFTGYFERNYLQGKGREQGEGHVFEGHFFRGTRSKGRLVWNIGKENQCSYEGQFLDGVFEGKGILSNENGVYQGYFSKGMKSGPGAFTWKNGDHFEGQYQRDMKNGPGAMYNQKGLLVLKTVWKDDKPVIQAAY